MWTPLGSTRVVSPTTRAKLADGYDEDVREPWGLEDVSVWLLASGITLVFVLGVGVSVLVRVV